MPILLRIILGVLIFLIFNFSTTSHLLVLNPSTWFNSAEYSDKVHISDLKNLNSSFYWGYFENGQNIYGLKLEFYMRKLAHIIMYATLSVAMYFNLFKYKNKLFISVLLTACIAFVDEVNQYLLIGRSGRLMDVILDTSAATVTLIVLNIIIILFINKKINVEYTLHSIYSYKNEDK